MPSTTERIFCRADGSCSPVVLPRSILPLSYERKRLSITNK
jgi:hypothetical protein